MRTERDLIARAMRGDFEAFDALFRQHRPRVLRCCHGIVHNPDDAEDMTEDTFLRAWLKRQTCRANNAASFQAWLCAIARNLCLRFLSQRQKRQEHEVSMESIGDSPLHPRTLASATPSPLPDSFGWSLLKHAAVREMDALPSKWRTAFLLMLQEHSHDDIARQMGITRNYVDVLLKRARERLQERLAPLIDRSLAPRGRHEVWQTLETQLRGLVADFRLVTVKVGDTGATLQLWVPVLDVTQQKKFVRRLQRLEKQVAQQPDNGQAWFQLAEHYQAQGELEKAIDAYQRVVTVIGCHSERSEESRRSETLRSAQGDEDEILRCAQNDRLLLHALTQLGTCFWTLHRRREAQAAFERALEVAQSVRLRPETAASQSDRLRYDADIAALRGHLHALRDDHAQAIRHYQHALSLLTNQPLNQPSANPSANPIRHRLATCYRAHGRPDLAVKEYETIIEEDPNDVTAYNQVADCYREMGDWNKTVAALERAAEIVPSSAPTLRHLAQKLVDTVQQMSRALELAQRAAHLAPDNWECWKTLGQIYRHFGRRDDAMTAYQKSISVSPNTAEPYLLYAAFLLGSEDYQQALWALKQAHRLEPENLTYWNSIAGTLLMMNNHAETLRWADRLAQRCPTDWNLCCGLSGIYRASGRLRKAVRWANEAVRLSPTNPAPWGVLGRTHAAAGELEKAVEAFEKAFSLLPPNALHAMPDMYLPLGELHHRLGNERRARAIFREGVKMIQAWLKAGHTAPGLHYHLAELHAALGNTRAARAAAHRALAHPSLILSEREKTERLLSELPAAPSRRARKTS